ncbi:MAG: TonB-dependent receptor, partial [Myxococcota bacterium]
MQRLGWLVGLGVSGSAWAVEVAGSVVDEDTGLPVADVGVVVVFGDATLQAVTAEDGSFGFDLPEGPASLEVISVEHQPLTASFVVAEGIAPLDLVLRPGDIEELTVLYYKEQDPVVTRRSVTAEEVVRVPGAFGDPVRVVTSLPGAARPPFGSSQLIIRGGNDDDTTVFIDGVEVPVVYHVGGYRSVVHPSMVAEVDFLPGIFPSRYGDTTSGVVDIQTRADWGEDWEITTQADLLDASASFRGTIADRVGVAGAIRRSYIDAVLIGLQNDFILPRWFDYQVQVQSLNTSPHTARLIVFGLQDRLGVDGSDFGITNATTSHRGVGSWVYEPNGRFKFLTQGTVGWDDDQIGLGTDISLVERGLRLGLRSEGRWTPDSRVVVVAGAQVQSSNLDIEATLPFDPTAGNADAAFEATEERWVTQPDPYLELQFRPSDRFLVNAGVRGEAMLREGLDPEFGVSPRVSLRGKLGRSATLKGGAGIVHQMPSSTALAFSPDTPLALERAYTAEVGWEQAFGKVATLDTVVYGRLMDRIATQQFGAAAFDNSGIGRAYGLEVLLRKEPTGPLFGWISYSLSRSERIDDPDETDEWTLFGLD